MRRDTLRASFHGIEAPAVLHSAVIPRVPPAGHGTLWSAGVAAVEALAAQVAHGLEASADGLGDALKRHDAL